MNHLRASHVGALGILALAVLTANPSGAVTPNGKLQIIHLDVGQGDGAVLITPLGQVAMFDDGGATFPSFPCSRILAQLDTLDITHVEYHFASHYHSDHIGCFPTIDNVVHFDEGWDRAGSYGTNAYTNYVNALGARRHTLTKGQVFTLDAGSAHPVTITCVDFIDSGSDDYENSKSVVLRVDYGYFNETFGGDLTGYSGSGRYDRETPYSPEVDSVMVYKVHHHSSKYSTNDTWLSKTAPLAAVISMGDNNPYGFPTPEALDRLHNHQVRTYWTERGSTSGASPDPVWDTVAHSRITINAVWEGQGKTVISGGYGANAFSDTLVNRGPAPAGACCSPASGICAVIPQAGCAAPDTWHSEWPSCDPNPCSFSGTVTLADPDRDAFLGTMPNPFSRTTLLRYRLSEGKRVRLEIFDAGGRGIRTMEAGDQAAGTHSLEWDGRSSGGGPVSPGVYFARLRTGEVSWTRTIIKIR